MTTCRNPEPETGSGSAVSLSQLLVDFGADWEITRTLGEPEVWIAISRPTPTASRVIAAHGLVELAVKLANA